MGQFCEMARGEYEKLKSSGMLWEFYPEATGNYWVDSAPREEKNQIKICVFGAVGTGKSVIAQLIKDKLVAEGFAVSLIDDEFEISYKFNERVKMVAEHTEVTISPILLRKGE